VLLVGRPEIVEPLLGTSDHPNIELVPSATVISFHDEPAAAVKSMLDSGLNFVGNVEGRDLLRNFADVVVTDGFTGNVALKLLEGCAASFFTRIKSAAESGTRAKVGGMLLRPSLRGLRTALDPEEVGGAYLLGVRGLVVICHGNSTRRAIANALLLGAEALRKGVLPAVRSEMERPAAS
jgi:glycerol-3-phosphate acyltransferase PlsX